MLRVLGAVLRCRRGGCGVEGWACVSPGHGAATLLPCCQAGAEPQGAPLLEVTHTPRPDRVCACAACFPPFPPSDSSQRHWPFPSDRVAQGYAYVLTHPGVPCVFWEHYFEDGHELQTTIDTLLQVSDMVGMGLV